MIQVKEMMQDNDLKNSKSKDKGSRSRPRSMKVQSHYKQDKTKTRQSINVKSHILNVKGDNDKIKQTPTRMSSVIVTQVTNNVNNANGRNGRNGINGGNRGNNGCTYKGFMACNPKEYDGKGEEFCPINEMEKLETKFWNHKMVGAKHAGYTDRFHELAKLVPHLVTLESSRIKRVMRKERERKRQASKEVGEMIIFESLIE
ncbi:hypothetical protein Tco_1474721 [Tanacetum coccineum]